MHNYTDSKVFTNKNYNIDLFHIKNQIHYLNIKPNIESHNKH